MNKPSKEHVEQGMQATVATAGAVNPILGGIIGVAAALFGPAIVRRVGRVDDIIQQIKDSPSIFTPTLLSNEQFQDGLIFFIEQYIRERNEDKLVIMRSIFAGFGQAPNLSEFPLEEMTDLVSRLRFGDIKLLKLAMTQDKQHQEQSAPEKDRAFKFNEHPFNVSRLVYFGLLMEDRTKNGSAIREADDPGFLFIWISPLGRQFAKYLDDVPTNQAS